MYTLTLLIRWLPESLNKKLNTHFYKRSAQNKAWDIYVATASSGKRPREPLPKARIRLIRHSHRMLDYDGLVGSMKPVVDALVSCGVLLDDSWNVTGAWEVDQRFRPKKDGPLLELTVESRLE